MTLEGLSESTGISVSHLSRMESGGRGAKLEYLIKIAKALGRPLSDIATPEELETAATESRNVRMVEVRGAVQAGNWAEAWEWPEDDRYSVPIPEDESFRRFSLFAVETRGPSMNRRYPDGTIIVVTDAIERGEQMIEGRRYIIERERADGLREATVKTLWRDDSGALWFIPESTDPRHQEPIPLSGAEGDTIRIVGRVVYSVNKET